MRQLTIVGTIILGIFFLSACAPQVQAEIPKILPTELNAPSFITDLLPELAKELQIDVNEIKLVSVEKVQWRDSCLGIEREGMMCMEVITPGYLVILETPLGMYEIHTNDNGSAYIFVPQGTGTQPTAVDQ